MIPKNSISAGPGLRRTAGRNGVVISKYKGIAAAARRFTPKRIGSLTLTTTPPAGFVPEDPPPSGIPWWITWGTAGGVVPPVADFIDPVAYITTAGTTYAWAKIGLSATAPLIATTLDFVSDPSPTAYPTAAFASDGTPPDFLYVPLGYIAATGSGATLAANPVPAGSGSIVVAMSLVGVSADSETGALSFTRALSWWRTPDA